MKRWIWIFTGIILLVAILFLVYHFIAINTPNGGEHDKCPFNPNTYSVEEHCNSSRVYCPAGIFYYNKDIDSCYEYSGGDCCSDRGGFETKERCEKICKGMFKYLQS